MPDTPQAENRDRTIIRTSIIGIAANIFLSAFKATVGLISHSIAITLDAVNNLSDAGSSIITIIGTKLAGKQPDKEHPWGHGRAEYLSAMVIAVIILYAGITSLVESIKKIISPQTPDYSAASLIIVCIAIVVKIVLSKYVKKTGIRVNSDPLINSGTDAMNDVFISASTLAAAIIFLLTGLSLEAWLGAVISVIIIKSGIGMLRGTISDLLGHRVSRETVTAVHDTLMEFPEINGVFDIIFHDYGPDRLNCSVHAEVPHTMTAVEIDQLERNAALEVYNRHGIILTAMSIYAMNEEDEDFCSIRDDISGIALSHDHVIQVHGFSLDRATNTIHFDMIVDFGVKDRISVYDHVVEEIREKYPDHTVLCTLDTDFSVSE
ncbi:MAG: cation transporter [Ruminococcus sp.]|nr:cation transporter [Ruminococcus sp.]